MPHYDQINVPCNVKTSATDHKYGGAELCYETRWEHRRKISHLVTVILIGTPFVHWRFLPRYSPVMQMHLTINRPEKVCMFPWIRFFLSFCAITVFGASYLIAAWQPGPCSLLSPGRRSADAVIIIMMANKRGNHVLCDHVSKYFMEINIFKENFLCWDCDSRPRDYGE